MCTLAFLAAPLLKVLAIQRKYRERSLPKWRSRIPELALPSIRASGEDLLTRIYALGLVRSSGI